MSHSTGNYILYTDGAYSSLRDQGGVGLIILKDNKKILEYSRMYKGVTNNIMELGAVIIGLKAIKNCIDSLVIFTDSMYVIGCATKGWKRSKNKSLWKEFDKQFQRVQELCSNIEFRHVKGHNGDLYNEEVDKLAVKASQSI